MMAGVGVLLCERRQGMIKFQQWLVTLPVWCTERSVRHFEKPHIKPVLVSTMRIPWDGLEYRILIQVGLPFTSR